MKNLLILHLESITRQRLATFGSAFPNTRRLIGESLAFDRFFSSATSTLMVIGYLCHANDFEFDTCTQFEAMRPAGNNRHLFSMLQGRGYNANLVSLNGFAGIQPTTLSAWSGDLPPVWATNDFPTLFARFDELTDAPPFAIYVWDLITHIEHSAALAPYSSGLTDQVGRACGGADDAIGAMLATLERKGLLENTTIVVYGDHGDDFWTHGFKGGMIHATEPYTPITWTPFAIRDPALAPGTNDALASTIDIAPTCRALLGVDEPDTFAYSGTNLLAAAPRLVHSQNFTANQPDNTEFGLVKAHAVTDDTYNLVVSSRGLELYAYRLDPGNHCNLLEFFDLAPGGRLVLRSRANAAPHFRSAIQDNARALADIEAHFATLRAALVERVAAKRAYITDRGAEPTFALDPRRLDVVAGRDGEPAVSRPDVAPVPAYSYTFKLG